MSSNLGTKRVCPKCDAKFYDFGAVTPITCPKCAKTWTEGAKKKAPAPKKEPKPTVKPVRKAADDEEMLGELPEVEGDETLEIEPMEDEGVELTSLQEVEEREEEEADENSDDADDEMFTEMGGEKIVDDFEEDEEDDEDEDDEDGDEDDEEDEDDEDDRPKKRRKKK